MMKKSLSIVSTLAVATVLTFSSAAFAQGSGTTGGTTGGDGGGTDTTTTRNDDRREDNGTDMGWLGLLGLAGLAGLLKKPERHVVHQTDVPRTNPTAR
jgi:hypothetical protein